MPMIGGGSTMPVDRLTAALDVLETFQSALGLLREMDAAAIRQGLMQLQAAKREQEDATQEARAERVILGTERAALESLRTESKEETDRINEKRKILVLAERDIVAGQRQVRDARGNIGVKENQIALRLAEADARDAVLDEREMAAEGRDRAISEREADVQRRLDAIRAAAGG